MPTVLKKSGRMASVATAKTPPVDDLIQALDAPVARERFSAAKALRMLSEAEPQSLYPYFEILLKTLLFSLTVETIHELPLRFLA